MFKEEKENTIIILFMRRIVEKTFYQRSLEFERQISLSLKDDNTHITEIQNSMTEHDYLSKGMKIKRKKVDKNDIRLKCRDNLN